MLATIFKYAAHATTGNGNYANLTDEIDLEKFVKSHQVKLLLAGFSHLEPLSNMVSTILRLNTMPPPPVT